MKPIDLGISYDDAIPMMTKSDREKHYPSFTYEGDEEMDLPEEGEMTIHFCKIGSSETERDGNKHYSCTVQVKKILDVKAEDYEDDRPKSSSRASEDALDELMEKKLKEKGY